MSASDRRADLALGLLFIVIAVAILVESASIPKGVFDPIGSGRFPLALSIILLALAALIMARALRTPREAPLRFSSNLMKLVAKVAALAVIVGAYCLALEFRVAPFELSTFVFVLSLGLLLGARRPTMANLGILAALGLAVGSGVKMVFTHVLYLSLP